MMQVINPIVTFPGEGTFLFGDKTFKATTSTLSRINVSRLFILLKRDIGRIARSILFEQNDVETRTNFVSRSSAVLRGIQADRGIFDFRLVCDETNNPPEKLMQTSLSLMYLLNQSSPSTLFNLHSQTRIRTLI